MIVFSFGCVGDALSPFPLTFWQRSQQRMDCRLLYQLNSMWTLVFRLIGDCRWQQQQQQWHISCKARVSLQHNSLLKRKKKSGSRFRVRSWSVVAEVCGSAAITSLLTVVSAESTT